MYKFGGFRMPNVSREQAAIGILALLVVVLAANSIFNEGPLTVTDTSCVSAVNQQSVQLNQILAKLNSLQTGGSGGCAVEDYCLVLQPDRTTELVKKAGIRLAISNVMANADTKKMDIVITNTGEYTYPDTSSIEFYLRDSYAGSCMEFVLRPQESMVCQLDRNFPAVNEEVRITMSSLALTNATYDCKSDDGEFC